MRAISFLVWSTILAVSVSAYGGDTAPTRPTGSATRAPLVVEIDKAKVDLKQHRLEVKFSRDAAKITLKVIGETGATLAEQSTDFGGRRAGTPLLVTWTPTREEPVGRIELFAYDMEGAYKGVALTPWSVSIPHQDVTFASNSFQIGDAERSKLEASYAKITEAMTKHQALGNVTLFLAGHTDTVGRDAQNLKLSQQRALAIATWFRQRGLTANVAYEGFGESSPLVKTGDEVEEPRNRRVDYILSFDEPTFKTSGFRPAWKRL